jgi:hypothetical protein
MSVLSNHCRNDDEENISVLSSFSSDQKLMSKYRKIWYCCNQPQTVLYEISNNFTLLDTIDILRALFTYCQEVY